MKKGFLQIFSVFAAILSLSIGFSVSALAENSSNVNLAYEKYFSEEHLFEDLTLSTNSNYLFSIDEDGRLYRYPNDKNRKDIY